MYLLFAGCAAVGGTILVLQFLLSLVGLGGHHDFGGDLSHDGGGDCPPIDDHAGSHSTSLSHVSDDPHETNLLFRMLSVRTVTAAVAFFGLAGLAADSASFSTGMTLLIALGAAAAAMYGVYAMMQGMQMLQAEGTARIEHAIGRIGMVYLRVPAEGSGSGKIQLNLQNRTMEFLAMTSGLELPTGTMVEVVGVVSPTTVAVEPIIDPERNDHA